jgi:hypothetical protein
VTIKFVLTVLIFQAKIRKISKRKKYSSARDILAYDTRMIRVSIEYAYHRNTRIIIGSPKMRVEIFTLARGARACMHRVYSVYYYDKVGKTFNGNLLQRLLEYEYFANYKQKQYKIYIISNTGNFTTFSQSFNFKSSF